jgi:hydrogenase maturation protein HypF
MTDSSDDGALMADSTAPRARWSIRVTGQVQGVGFRPFVVRQATAVGVSGLVGNDGAGVFIEAEGNVAALQSFADALTASAPPLARVDTVQIDTVQIDTVQIDPVRADPTPLATASRGFVIVASRSDGHDALIPADAATCPDCLRELRDPTDRRFGYPFTNCTNCGPRYTIVTGVPYDRPMTTMAGFPMCATCRGEYGDPLDRRYHAQPVCCPDCGPRLSLLDADGSAVRDADPVSAAARLLSDGGVVAIKGLGGYHLAVLAGDDAAVTRLRSRKHREQRPFAVMVAGLDAARTLCHVSEEEARLLEDTMAPIVLLRRRADAAVAAAVAPKRAELGLMLPYTPLHHLLLDAVGAPVVLTSGNRSDEPIAFEDTDAQERLRGVADALLTHDRPIHTRVDDSVVRVVGGRVVPIRRSRGHVPDPVRLPLRLSRPVLAVGPELKNTFCLARGSNAFVSHHIGDLENFETLSSFTTGIAHLTRLLDISPAVVAHDLHPDYLSTAFALDLAAEHPTVELVGVQHHHAHIASCLADNGVAGPVIGVAFDGLGMGDDGTLWGGEFLVADLAGFTREGHLAAVPMPGGAAAIRQPWRMAAAHLDAAYDGNPPAGLAVMQRNTSVWGSVLTATRAGVNAPMTSSMGRLFDAVSALVTGRDTVSYEGQAAIELEQVADPDERGSYPVVLHGTGPTVVDAAALLRAVVDDLTSGTAAPVVSARFHSSIVALVTTMCLRLREIRQLNQVALSGGVFQNVLLLSGCVDALRRNGFEVLTHRQVPTNDGGVSLGQAAVAGARDRLVS